jgi:Repeat of unknown function (DUF5648)
MKNALLSLNAAFSAAALLFASAPTFAVNTPSQYFCEDYWYDSDGRAIGSIITTQAINPPISGNRIVVTDVPEANSAAELSVRYFTRNGEPGDLVFHGVRSEAANLYATATYPMKFRDLDPFGGGVSFQKTLSFPKPSPGDYRINVQVPYGCSIGTAGNSGAVGLTVSQWILRVAGPRPTVIVNTMAYMPSNRYFMTASLEEVQFLRTAPGFAASFALLEDNFRAWPVFGDVPPSAVPVCRFFRASTITHAYSADTAECASMRADPAWRDEGVTFRALVPSNGACAASTEPIYKLTNATLGDTQRYTRSEMTYRTLALNGWTQRGIAFCSPVG